MTLLENIKYEVEEELGNPTEDIEGADLWVDEIAKRYAKAVLERAADIDKQETPNYCGGGCGKQIPKNHKFCSHECTKAWAFD